MYFALSTLNNVNLTDRYCIIPCRKVKETVEMSIGIAESALIYIGLNLVVEQIKAKISV